MLSRIPAKYLSLLCLCLWGGAILYFGAVRFDAFALDEGAAHALLLNWSVSDQIVNPIATYGGPDFRALLFIPLGLYWPGSIIAAKVFTIVMMFIGSMILYSWSRTQQSDEVALIATGLLLISPVALQNIDSISVGPYLLLMFGLGALLDKKYRQSQHSISGLYFLQCITVAITVTLHPMGLAYPAALAWQWYKNPKAEKQQKQVWLGIAIAVIIVLVMQTGWIDLKWLSNPVIYLDQAAMGKDILPDPDNTHWLGYVLFVMLIAILYRSIKTATDNLLGSMLMLGVLLGLFVADQNWALISFAVILFYGTAQLIQLNQKFALHNFIGQRGLVMAVIIICTSVFVQIDKVHTHQNRAGILSPEDQLIDTLASIAKNTDKPFLAASQWPARSMIVCRRDVLHLPPPAKSGQALLKSIKGLTHVMFNHRDPRNSQLARNFSEITDKTETLSIQDGGVIIHIKSTEQPAAKKTISAPADKTQHDQNPASSPAQNKSDVPHSTPADSKQ